ncbi:MAG: hypothetical protein M1813_005167 [Trichoglossum hirsutum]|nr:MAG: hypothetical protein M1813_005167 [Trichoglossum hirsutum]
MALDAAASAMSSTNAAMSSAANTVLMDEAAAASGENPLLAALLPGRRTRSCELHAVSFISVFFLSPSPYWEIFFGSISRCSLGGRGST